MSYYFSTKIAGTFDDVIDRTRQALKTQGFGIISEIDIQAALREKIGVDFRRYTILGACNPALALEALQIEDKVGTMLPCNVVVQEQGDGIEVAAIDPVASMQAIENRELSEKAAVVAERLEDAVRGLLALDFAGANVTTPHKVAVARLVETDEPSVNTLVVRDGRVFGSSTERSLRRTSFPSFKRCDSADFSAFFFS